MNTYPGTKRTRRATGSVSTAILWLLLALLAAVAIALPAAAQQRNVFCGERTKIAKALYNNYEETPVASGLAEAGAVIEIFASPQGTWTMLITTPAGQSCYMASGESWENVPQIAGRGTKI